MSQPLGPPMLPTEWVTRIASLVHTIRPDWHEPGIRAALAKVADRPLIDVTIAAVTACRRVDQRIPDIIAMDGTHWPGPTVAQRTYTEPGIVTRCEHGEIGARCLECNPRKTAGPSLTPEMRAQIRAALHQGQAEARGQQ